MPKKFEYNYDDSLLTPKNADEQIGWSGVPLSQTCGYTGMIPRATVPTNDKLGFDPAYDTVDADKILAQFMPKLNAAFDKKDVDGLVKLFYEDGWWRDLYLLTMDSRSLRGPDKITHMLNERLAKTGVKNIQLMDLPKPTVEFMGEDLAFITAHFKLEWALGTGSGMIRLAPTKAKSGTKEELADVNVWEIYHISTTMDTLQGINPDSGERVRDRRPKLLDPLGKARTYTQMREDEKECLHGFEPTVLIVGAGQCGLMTAARFKMLGIPTLIIDKAEAPGASWANRYASLSLHNTSSTNTFPVMPFPDHFPDFIPAQQLAKFMRNYADTLDLNVWTHSTIDGENAVYDEKTGKWTVTVTRGDGSQRVLHPKYLILAIGISGTLPALPKVPGLEEFEKAGGKVVHSSRHRTTPDMRGKKVVVVGAATSAHDLAWELHENGLDVTMIQRSSTHIISVDKGVRMMYSKFENLNKPGGMDLNSADRATWLGTPFPVTYELAPRLFKAIREADKETIDGLHKVGYRTNDGFHGGGAAALTYFNLGGYFFDTGFCKIIADGKIRIEHSEVDHLEKGKVVLQDGTKIDADLVVYANGYFDSKAPIEAVMGSKMAEKCNEFMEKGNSFIIDPEGEMRTYFRPLAQKGLFATFQQFGFVRYYSARFTLWILAQELGLGEQVEPYGELPFTPRTAVAMQPRKQ